MHGGRIGVLVEIGCETDFVAGTDEFKAFAHEVALQISAQRRRALDQPRGRPGRRRSRASSRSTAPRPPTSPRTCATRSPQGKLDKWLSTVCLLEQPYVRDSDRTVDDLRTEIAAKTGENVQIKRFTRYERGA